MQFAITGNPITHSLSPMLFQAAYHGRYSYGLLIAETAEEAVRQFKEKEMKGMNVTAPFKTDILNFCDDKSEEIAKIGAVNTIVMQVDGRLKAYNTDYLGITGSLREFGVSVAGKVCVVLGAGGAGRAVAYALKEKMSAEVHVVNRTLEKATDLAASLKVQAHSFNELEQLLPRATLIVNTLDPLVAEPYAPLLSKGQVVFDASYKNNLFIDLAFKQGCKCIDGRYWLFHQAVPAYTLFTGERPDEEAMREALNIVEEDE